VYTLRPLTSRADGSKPEEDNRASDKIRTCSNHLHSREIDKGDVP